MKPAENNPITPPEELNEAETAKLSRRRLLKALAATGGAVTASTLLPAQWAKPIVQVGNLPVYAQTSPAITVSNLSVTLPSLNDCTQTGTGLTGSTTVLSLSYNDPTGRVTTGSAILLSGDVGQDITSISLSASNVTVSGNASSGAITVSPLCTVFDQDAALTINAALRNADGLVSNTISVVVPRPAGANSNAAQSILSTNQ